MSNDELTILMLDKYNWQYDDIANPNHYKNTEDLLLGDLILSIFSTESLEQAAKSIGRSYKVVFNASQLFFVPIFGKLHGGGQTWKWKFLTSLEIQECSNCRELLSFNCFDTDISSASGKHHYCKACRKEFNSRQYQKDSTKESHKKSQEKHYHDILARNAKYRAERKLRTVAWADQEKLKEIYDNCPEGMHVDHIIPLKGELVSGLHVHNNLQYLSPEENIKKGNRFEV